MPISESIYEKITSDQDERICDEIGDDACREAPYSFVLILGSSLLTKLGDAIASPKTTLAWLTSAVGAPPFVLGLLVPLREAGSMIPQLFVGGVIRKLPLRKWVWIGGSAGQGLCILGMGAVAYRLEGVQAGWTLLFLIATFSLARALTSVAAKDVIGKTIPKPKRGQLTGWSASLAGLLTIGVGLTVILATAEDVATSMLGTMFLLAGLLWFVAAALYAQIKESPGAVDGGRSAFEALQKLRILVADKPFRRFVVTRALLMCSALSAPFYVAMAQDSFGSRALLLGAFVIAFGLAGLVSAPIWGIFADQSSKHVMAAGGLLTASLGIAVFLSSHYLPQLLEAAWFLPLTYFLLSVAHNGVRVGRKTYVVNLASGNQRTDYVAISNTVIGVLLLLVGSVGALTPLIGNGGVIGILAVMGLAGSVLAMTLKKT